MGLMLFGVGVKRQYLMMALGHGGSMIITLSAIGCTYLNRLKSKDSTMTISHELRQLSAAIDYLNRKRGELLDDLKENPENHGSATLSQI